MEEQLEDLVNEYKLNAMKLNELKAKITQSEVEPIKPWVAYKCITYFGDCIFVVIADNLSNIEKPGPGWIQYEEDKVYAVLINKGIKSKHIAKIERYKKGN